jgi:hypothetical protein
MTDFQLNIERLKERKLWLEKKKERLFLRLCFFIFTLQNKNKEEGRPLNDYFKTDAKKLKKMKEEITLIEEELNQPGYKNLKKIKRIQSMQKNERQKYNKKTIERFLMGFVLDI